MPSGVKLAIGIVLFLIGGVIVIHGYPLPERAGLAAAVENELAEEARAALASPRGEGPYDWAAVAFDGQVARLSGVAPDEMARGGAYAAVLQSVMSGGVLLGGVTQVIDETCPPPMVLEPEAFQARGAAQGASRCETEIEGPYRFSAVRTGSGPVAVEGFAPSRRERADIIAAATSAFGEDFQHDHLRFAGGPPEDADWSGAIAFGLEQLGRTRSGVFRLTGLAAHFEAQAGSEALREDILADLRGFPEPFVLNVALELVDESPPPPIDPPAVSPVVSVETEAPSGREETGATLETAVRAAFGINADSAGEAGSSRLCQSRINALMSSRAVTFAVSAAELEASSRALLDLLADAAQRCSQFEIRVTGHTDDTGDPARNLALSQARAEAVVAYLVEAGVSADRLTATGRGHLDPRADNATPEGRAQNRRIEFEIID